MNDYSKSLDKEGWSKHYNMSELSYVVESVQNDRVQVWAKELMRIISKEKSCLEIGCGSGATALWLAKHNRKVSALDYTDSSVELIKVASKQLNLSVNIYHHDATTELPFEDEQFDYIYQCGLLEHFSTEEQIKLLKKWKKKCKYMISMIPNAASLPYRIGKAMMEKNGTWEYGLETPKISLSMEFTKAGIDIEKEYSIGTRWALNFLPKASPLRLMYLMLMKKDGGVNLDEYMQGYLLVTIGRCNNEEGHRE